MGIFLLILIVIIAAVIAIGYALGLFKIEKVEMDSENQAEFTLPDRPVVVPDLELDDGVSLREKMGIPDKPADEGPDSEDDAAKEDPEADADGKKSANAKKQFSQYDPLCNFKTGRSYLIDCQRALSDAQESGSLFAAVSLDIDRFRFINSLKGMSIGDYVLTRLGQELPALLPEGSLITRVSADHFAALFPLASMDMFDIISERLQDICGKLRSDVSIKSNLRVCMGVAVTQDSSVDYDISVLLHKANVARHCIKASRTDSWKLFEDTMISTYLYGESALEDYNENQYDEEFSLYFVPQQDIRLRHNIGCEALVRWSCEDSGKTLSPSINKSKIPTCASKVLYQSCKAMSRWRKAGKQVLPTCVSLPITEFYKEDVDDLAGKILTEFQLDPQCLAIVVEASILRVDWSAAFHQMTKFREMGVPVGVDEVDLGYTDLTFLQDLPVSFIKLHRSYAGELRTNTDVQETAKKLLYDAKAMGIRVLFEGVDSQEQADLIQELGGQEIQGQFCGRPQPSEEFLQGLPAYVEKQKQNIDSTVILDDVALNKGDFTLF